MKFTKLENHDLRDALITARELEYFDENTKLEHFIINRKLVPLNKILQYDDYGSWGQWSKGELENLSEKELIKELKSFRGNEWANLALDWIKKNKIPPIIIFPKLDLIGDGRGRVSLAVGLNIPKLEVIFLE